METWFRISINGGSGYMKLLDGEFAGYFDDAGNIIVADESSSVWVTENNVGGPNA